MLFPAPRPAALAVALSLALCTHAHAASPNPETPEVLDAVIVTVPPGPASTTVTDPGVARQPVPASDGADYLEAIPGFASVRNGGTNGDPVLRGMFGSRLNLLSNDGVMPGGCPSRMDNPLSYVAPETFDRLVVTKGPQTVRWGPGASAGTVRFERDTAPFIERDWRAQGSLLVGTAGRTDAVAELAFGGPGGHARLDANRSRADDYRDGSGRVVPSAWDKWNADLTLGWTPDTATSVTLGIGRGDGEARYAGRSMDGTRFVREAYSLRATRAFEGRLRTLEASVYDNTADHVMDNYTLRDPNPLGTMPMPMGSNVVRRTRGGRIAADWTLGAWALALGIDGSHSEHEGRNARGVDAWRARPLVEDAWFRNLGAFGEATLSIDGGRRIALGARVDRRRARPPPHHRDDVHAQRRVRRAPPPRPRQRLPAHRAGCGGPARRVVRGHRPRRAHARLLGAGLAEPRRNGSDGRLHPCAAGADHAVRRGRAVARRTGRGVGIGIRKPDPRLHPHRLRAGRPDGNAHTGAQRRRAHARRGSRPALAGNRRLGAGRQPCMDPR